MILNQSKVLKIILLLTIHYSLSLSIFVKLHFHSPHCYVKHVTAKEELKINYIVTGESERNIRFQIFEATQDEFELHSQSQRHMQFNPIPIYTVDQKNELEHTLTPGKDDFYQICFRNLDGRNKLLSFNFEIITEEQGQENLNDETKESLLLIQQNLKSVRIINRQQQSQSMRSVIHTLCINYLSFLNYFKEIQKTEKKVKWCAFIKMQIVIVICLAQIYILTNFLKKNQKEGV